MRQRIAKRRRYRSCAGGRSGYSDVECETFSTNVRHKLFPEEKQFLRYQKALNEVRQARLVFTYRNFIPLDFLVDYSLRR